MAFGDEKTAGQGRRGIYAPGHPPPDLSSQSQSLQPTNSRTSQMSGVGGRTNQTSRGSGGSPQSLPEDPDLYAPAYPTPVELLGEPEPPPPKPMSGYAKTRLAPAGRRQTFGTIPTEIILGRMEKFPVATVTTFNKVGRRSIAPAMPKLGPKTKKDLVSYQTRNIRARLLSITPQDLEEDDIVPGSGRDEVETSCWNKRYYVEEGFEDQRKQASFMSKTMLLMCLYLLPGIALTFLVIKIKPFHFFLTDGWPLYLALSCGFLLCIRIAAYQIRNFNICVLLFVARSIAFANTMAAATLATERLVIATAFHADYEFQNASSRVTKRPLPQANMTDPNTLHFLDRFTYTDVYIWGGLLVLRLTILMVSILVLQMCRKVKPLGIWAYGIPAAIVVPSLLFNIGFLAYTEIGVGPRLWDISQIFVSHTIAQLEALTLPFRWRRIFEGKSFYVTETDYVYAALQLTL